ncbi:MAG: hypothetical protein JOZ96_17805 [Acidobacteria bacterium]|nr:hypothetical protein [Acidobacteriota bacterium]
MRSRSAAGLLLLVLTAHAFVASATHFHRLPQPGNVPAQLALQNGADGGEGTPLGGDEKQCLLCRLQRNLVSDLHHAAVIIAAPPARTPAPEPPHEVAARRGAVRLRQGRAPPSVQS